MKVRLCARVSTDHQDADSKMKELRQWAKRNNHQIIDEVWIYESATQSLGDRVEFKKLLDFPKGEALVINKLDRLTRNFDSVSFIENYFRTNWSDYKLIALDFPINLENATGRLMFRQMLTFACFESEVMKERQVLGIARAKAEGKYKGRPKGALGKSNPQKLNI
jgi:DNA invertase Pin-like site-specific DNA recombinase